MSVKTGEHSHRPVALVTGAAVRIGRAIAQALAEAGYDLALHYHRSGQEAEDLAAQLRNTDCTCELFQADLAEPKQAGGLVPAVMDRFSRLNLLVNNASIFENACEKPNPIYSTGTWPLTLRRPFFCLATLRTWRVKATLFIFSISAFVRLTRTIWPTP